MSKTIRRSRGPVSALYWAEGPEGLEKYASHQAAVNDRPLDVETRKARAIYHSDAWRYTRYERTRSARWRLLITRPTRARVRVLCLQVRQLVDLDLAPLFPRQRGEHRLPY